MTKAQWDSSSGEERQTYTRDIEKAHGEYFEFYFIWIVNER